jgi:hypothetical protein
MSRLIVLRGLLALIVLATTGSSVRAQKTAEAIQRSDAAVAKALAAKTDVDALNVPLEDLLKDLAKRHGISIELDNVGLRRANVARSIPVTASFKQVTLGTALRLILRPLKLQFRVAHGTVVIDGLELALDEMRNAPAPANQLRAQPLIRRRGQNIEQLRQAQAVRMVQINQRNEQATLQQLRPLLQIELIFVKRICAPTPKQMQEIKQDGLKELAEACQQFMGQRNAFQNGRARLSGEARQVMQEKLAASVRSHLSPDQASHYETEIRKRNTNIREVCARNLVVILDHELSLSAGQREKLCAELAANWDDAWTQAVAFASINDQELIPNIPDDLVYPYLDAAQQTLWNSLPKTGFFNWGIQPGAFLGMTPAAMEDED